MKRTHDELKKEFSQNKRILDRLKKETVKLLKNVDKDSFNHSSAIAQAATMILQHEETIENQLSVMAELTVIGDSKDQTSRKSLFENVKNGDCAAIAVSYIDGGSLETTDKDMWTPLHIAALNGHKGIAEFLLKMGAKIDSLNSLKQSPLHVSASHDTVGVARVLLEHEANPFAHSKDKQCPHCMAVSKEMKELLQEFEFKFAEAHMNEPYEFLDHCKGLLFCALRNKNYKFLPLVLQLSDRGFSVGVNQLDERGNSALHLAVMNEDIKSLELVLKTQPYPFRKNKDDKYPIQLATSKKIVAIMEEYEQDYIGNISGSANTVKHMGNELLLYCAQKGYKKAVEDLLAYVKSGLVDLNTCDANENTPLHMAVKHGWDEIAALLLRYGAEMMMVNKYEKMPADYIGNNKKLIRIFNNFERIWVNRILQSYLRK